MLERPGPNSTEKIGSQLIVGSDNIWAVTKWEWYFWQGTIQSQAQFIQLQV